MAADPERQAWNSYFWPGTDVLQNNLGIRDPEALAQVEYQITAGRERGIESGQLPIEGETSADRLMSIHNTLFGEVYPWAGEYRTVNMQKGSHGFGDHASMGMYMRQLDGKINRFDWGNASFDEKVDKLGELHTDLNFAHPFREGNGRTARLFMADLASSHGVELNFDEVDKPTWNEASAATYLDPAGIRMDPTPMQEVYRRISAPSTQSSPQDTATTDSKSGPEAYLTTEHSQVVEAPELSALEPDTGEVTDEGLYRSPSSSPISGEHGPSVGLDEGYGAGFEL
jgi:cell filamentation protein